MRDRILAGFFVFICSALSGEAHAGKAHAGLPPLLPKVAYCATLLEQLRPGHSSAGLSESNTKAAIEFLRRFRIEVLNVSSVEEPRVEAMELSSGGWGTDSARQRLAEQIRGIELGARQQEKETPGVESNPVLWASVIRGSEQVGQFYAALEKGARENASLHPIHLLTLAFFHYQSLNKLGDDFLYLSTVDLPDSEKWKLFALMLPISIFRSGADRYYRLARETLFLPQRTIDRSAQAALREDPARWHFFSTQTSIFRQELQPRASKARSLLLPHLSFLESALGRFFLRVTEKAEGKTDASKTGANDQIWFHSDLLATFDPATGDPVLVASVRYSLTPPQFPKKKTRSVKEKLEDLMKEPLPLPIGAR